MVQLPPANSTWGSFMRVIAAQSEISGSSVIAGKDTARWIAEMGLYEARKGGKAFSQLYAAQALRHFGADLNKKRRLAKYERCRAERMGFTPRCETHLQS